MDRYVILVLFLRSLATKCVLLSSNETGEMVVAKTMFMRDLESWSGLRSS